MRRQPKPVVKARAALAFMVRAAILFGMTEEVSREHVPHGERGRLPGPIPGAVYGDWQRFLGYWVGRGWFEYREMVDLAVEAVRNHWLPDVVRDAEGGVSVVAEREQLQRFARIVQITAKEQGRAEVSVAVGRAYREGRWVRHVSRVALLDGFCPLCGEELGSCDHGYEKAEYDERGNFRWRVGGS